MSAMETLSASELDRLSSWWWTCWMGMHWGFRRHACVYWCCTGKVSPFMAESVLGINVSYSFDIVVFYRELVVNLIPEYDLAKKIVAAIPKQERRHISRFFAGKNVFETGNDVTRSIHELIDEVTVPAGLPALFPTDDGPVSRVPSFRMVFEGLRRTHSMRTNPPQHPDSNAPLLFISAECPELISAMPSLEYDKKNEEDVALVGTKQDDIWMGCCNAYRNYPSVSSEAPVEVRRLEAINQASTQQGKYMNFLKFNADFMDDKPRPRKR